MISMYLTPQDKVYFYLVVIFIGAVVLSASFLNNVKKDDTIVGASEDVADITFNQNSMNDIQEPVILPDDQIKNKKSIISTEKGDIVIELFADEAPLTVSNHVMLVQNKFYDGLTFHRREEGFVIQGGDPAGNGTGGPGYTFADEPVTREYSRGIVAMANRGPNTNGSQFFIMLEDHPLPPYYTIFGEVISGMEFVDAIQVGDVMLSIKIEER